MGGTSDSHVAVAVVGGGIAGIAAAVRLAEQGTRVTLLERSNRLGGRAGSFHDPTLDEPIDNCQHVALGCCDAYTDLLRTLGSDTDLEWTSSFHYVEPGGRVSTLPIPDWPSPLHGLPLLARARFLSVADRLAIARAMSSLLRSPKGTEHKSFADWLAAKRQPASVIERFWAPIVVSACNARPDQCDASAAIKVFRDGFLASAQAARMGVPKVPLAQLYSRVPELLEALGGSVRLTAQVESIEPNRVTLRSGE
ncbi:MAG: FAD-dependent oxidoreductase, partial [Planctomycetota bacterium]